MASTSSPSPGKDKESPAKRTKYDYLQDLTVLVGAEATRFVLHRDIVCRTSDFFRVACNGDWKESADKTVRLEETAPEIFTIYLGWLYTNEVDLSSKRDQDSTLTIDKDTDGSTYSKCVQRLVYSFILGDMLLDEYFRNAVTSQFMRLTEAWESLPSEVHTRELWPQVPLGSTLSRLWVDYLAADFDTEVLCQEVSSYPPGLVIEVAKICVREQRMDWRLRKPRNRGKCYYHEHKDESDKCT